MMPSTSILKFCWIKKWLNYISIKYKWACSITQSWYFIPRHIIDLVEFVYSFVVNMLESFKTYSYCCNYHLYSVNILFSWTSNWFIQWLRGFHKKRVWQVPHSLVRSFVRSFETFMTSRFNDVKFILFLSFLFCFYFISVQEKVHIVFHIENMNLGLTIAWKYQTR